MAPAGIARSKGAGEMTVSSPAGIGTPAKPEEPPAIFVTEVAALGYPADGGYEYRGLLRSLDASGTLLLETALHARRRPEWLVNVRHPKTGALELALLLRPGDALIWREVGRVALSPAQLLENQSSAVADLVVPGWDEAPDLRLRVRLSAAPAQEPGAGRPVAPIRGKPARPVPLLAAAGEAEPTITPEALESLPALTSPEEVIVKDVWNKLLAFQDLLVEMFFERLLHEEPDLIERFGNAIDSVPEHFAGFFDLCVRQMAPRTEQILRESYRGVYPRPAGGPQTVAEYAAWFAERGMRPQHWLTANRVWAWMLPSIPYLEEYDRENLARGPRSALWRFFNRHILPPALRAIQHYDAALTPALKQEMRRCGEVLAANEREIGIEFYRMLFETHPEVLPFFGRTDIDGLAGNLMKSFAILVRSLDGGERVRAELGELAARLTRLGVPPDAYPKIAGPMLAILARHVPGFTPDLARAWETQFGRVVAVLRQPMLNRRRLLTRARDFLGQIAREQQWDPADYKQRWTEIKGEVNATGVYTHTYEELAYGAQIAWRNSGKCIGRISWQNLIVRDLRHVTDPDAMFRECVEHLRMATNGGNVQIVMSVFRPKRPGERWGPRIWNSQYLRFAGYEQEDGGVLGDGANRELTRAIVERLGWRPPEPKSPFDILPLVIEAPGHPPRLYEFPREELRTIPIEHPTIPAIGALGLRWCTIPAITNFRLEIGGIQYGCIPFNGWFMGTEIARNLWEEGRYDKAEEIARAIGLDTTSEQTLWRDRAFLELNVAVLHSFARERVTLVDHQTASRQFLVHDLREKKAGRECPAQWSWVVPAAGGSTTPVWHHEMRDFYLTPQFHYAADKWAVLGSDLREDEIDEDADEAGPDRLVILYASETGTAEGFARQTARRLKHLRPRVMALDDYDVAELGEEGMVLAITSTFGEGEMPGNGRNFLRWLREQPEGAYAGLDFAVLALGSTVYPNFCAAGQALDRELGRVGGIPLVPLHKGDEIKGQTSTFRQWLDLVARQLGEDPTSANAAAAAAEVRLRAAFFPPGQTPAHAGTTRQLRLPGVEAPLADNRELLEEVIPGSRSTRFLAFDISGTDMTYETGDHLAVYPRNPPALVRRVCERLHLDPDAWFTTALVDRQGSVVEGDSPYPEPVTVGQVLTEDVDLALRDPSMELIAALHGAAGDRAERDRLGAWVETLGYGEQDAVCAVLKGWLSDFYMNVAELLEAFPSTTLTLEQLIELLPRQRPRFYSIASCPLVHPHRIHLSVGVLQVVTDAARTRQGLCSNYLAGLEIGDTARISVRTSHFRPPADLGAPMILVGPGTGLSPLIGFLEYREAQLRRARAENPKAVPGPARLYFGCRSPADFLYRRALEGWRDLGVLSHLDVAYSRVTDHKIYVQHRVAEQRRTIWELLSRPDCHYFVCGDAKMSDEVFEALMNIARTEGGLSHFQAVEFFRNMHAENRFLTDVWGVTFHFRQALDMVREAKYSQAERWLQRVSAEEESGEEGE